MILRKTIIFVPEELRKPSSANARNESRLSVPAGNILAVAAVIVFWS